MSYSEDGEVRGGPGSICYLEGHKRAVLESKGSQKGTGLLVFLKDHPSCYVDGLEGQE